MQVVDSTGKVLFQQPPPGSTAPAIDTLAAGATLAQSLKLYSLSGQYYMSAQSKPVCSGCACMQSPGYRKPACICLVKLGASHGHTFIMSEMSVSLDMQATAMWCCTTRSCKAANPPSTPPTSTLQMVARDPSPYEHSLCAPDQAWGSTGCPDHLMRCTAPQGWL